MAKVLMAQHWGKCFGVKGVFYPVVAAEDGRIIEQRFKASAEEITEQGKLSVTVHARFDDECHNGRETFAITASIYLDGRDYMGGACHDEIVKHFPKLEPLLKWHLTSIDGPMYYVENTVYLAREHGPKLAWVYHTPTGNDPLGIGERKEVLLGYVDASKARKAEGVHGYRVVWDEKTAKRRNLDGARKSAVWPDATDEELMQEPAALEAALRARLPALRAQFKQDMLKAGFLWPEAK